jgi:hypothetical protein
MRRFPVVWLLVAVVGLASGARAQAPAVVRVGTLKLVGGAPPVLGRGPGLLPAGGAGGADGVLRRRGPRGHRHRHG